MRHLDESFTAFGSVFLMSRLTIVFPDISQLIVK
jgi:hypothetical protein